MKCLKDIIVLAAFILNLSGCRQSGSSVNNTIENPVGWIPVWVSEFDYSGLLDTSIWDYAIGGHGWGPSSCQQPATYILSLYKMVQEHQCSFECRLLVVLNFEHNLDFCLGNAPQIHQGI